MALPAALWITLLLYLRKKWAPNPFPPETYLQKIWAPLSHWWKEHLGFSSMFHVRLTNWLNNRFHNHHHLVAFQYEKINTQQVIVNIINLQEVKFEI